MELDLGDVSIPQALNSGLTMHGERADRNGITMTLTVGPEVDVIRADERKVRQVIFNLLSNAVKFTPPRGRIDVSAFVTDGVVEVAVSQPRASAITVPIGFVPVADGNALASPIHTPLTSCSSP